MNRFFSKVVGCTAFVALNSSIGFADAPQTIESYLQRAHLVVDELTLEQPNASAIVSNIDAMLEDAKPVVIAFGVKHGQCANQMDRVIELYPEIANWTAQEIRRNIEGAGMLPPAEGCYAARDIVAHPAIVRALSRSGIQSNQRQRLTNEMKEAIEHMEEIAAEFAGE